MNQFTPYVFLGEIRPYVESVMYVTMDTYWRQSSATNLCNETTQTEDNWPQVTCISVMLGRFVTFRPTSTRDVGTAHVCQIRIFATGN